MVKTITILSLASIISMAITLHLQLPVIYLLISLLVNLSYLIVQCYQKTQQQRLSQLVLHGEVLANVLYTVWLFFLQSKEYIFYLPLVISLPAKIYLMVTPNISRNQTLAENYIVLQGKIEFLMIVYTSFLLLANLLTFSAKTTAVVLYLLLLAIFRIKYQANYAFQRSINQIHLFFDRTSKKFGFRPFYHTLYKILANLFCVSDHNTGKRVIRY